MQARSGAGHGGRAAAGAQAVHAARPADGRARGQDARAAAASSRRGSGTCTSGRQTLVSRGVYRLRDNQRGEIVFQLFGNGWRFARGHTAKLELLGRDPNFLRPSNFRFSVRVSKLTRVEPARPVTEERAQVGEVELVYETIGDPADPPLLLVMGLGMQLIHWDRELCELLAERGFHVIRFDNRDAGLSTKIDAPVPNVMRADGGLADRARPTCWTTWPRTRSACSTTSASSARTWWAPRWAA